MMIALCSMIDNPADVSKFVRIYRKYRRTMYTVAFDVLNNVHDAEDAVQNSLINVIGILYKIADQDVPRARCKNLMITIAKNEAVDLQRKKNHLPIPDEKVERTGDNRDVADLYIEMEDYRNLVRYIGELRESYQDVLRLRIVYDLTAKETANILHISEDNVNMRLLRAKQQLAKKLKEGRE